MTFMVTRIKAGDYEVWKPLFDKDVPNARQWAKGHRILRSLEDPGEVFILVEFGSADEARTGRERLLASGVLDRFSDKAGPTLAEETEAVSY